MPLYEYECPVDGTFEKMQKFSDPPLTACPKCGGPVEKLLSAPAIQFKGSGWYITDYARKGTGSEPKADKPAEAKSTETKSTESSAGSDKGSTSATKPTSGTSTGSTDKK